MHVCFRGRRPYTQTAYGFQGYQTSIGLLGAFAPASSAGPVIVVRSSRVIHYPQRELGGAPELQASLLYQIPAKLHKTGPSLGSAQWGS